MRYFQLALLFIWFSILCIPSITFAASSNYSSNEYAQAQLQSLKALIENNREKSDWHKINLVNQFFNRVAYVSDQQQWGVEDYWASPVEFLQRNAGDCEDYSIAKYFTLRAMGVDTDRLRMTYVNTLPDQKPHMVLVYFEGVQRVPLVLDNLEQSIEPLTIRTDLDPVYSFNHKGLWLAHRNPRNDEFVGSTKQVGYWDTLAKKVSEEQLL